MPTSPDDQRDEAAAVLKLYEENGKVAAVFWEWRHKIISLAALTLGGVVGIAAWLYERDMRWAVCIPLLAGSLSYSMCWRLDRRVATVLDRTYRHGARLESMIDHIRGAAAGDVWI